MSTERVMISGADLRDAKVVLGAIGWGESLAPILAARGVPQRKLAPGYLPFRMLRAESGVGYIFEFGDVADHTPEVSRLSA